MNIITSHNLQSKGFDKIVALINEKAYYKARMITIGSKCVHYLDKNKKRIAIVYDDCEATYYHKPQIFPICCLYDVEKLK